MTEEKSQTFFADLMQIILYVFWMFPNLLLNLSEDYTKLCLFPTAQVILMFFFVFVYKTMFEG